MSRFLSVFIPAGATTAAVLLGAYMFAGQLVDSVPEPTAKRTSVQAAASEPTESPDGTARPKEEVQDHAVATDAIRPGGTARSKAEIQAGAVQVVVSEGDPVPVSAPLGLGRPATAEEIAAWDIDVRPDGQGLPEGAGDVLAGEEVFAERCAVCHGDFGEAVGRWPVLAGGQDSLTDDRPVKTIGSYWPYLSTVWDYVHRAMPFGDAQSLSDDEVYAVTAYLLYLNDLVDEEFELTREDFMEVRLPNEANFFPDDRSEGEYALFSADPCMKNCKEGAEITMRAAVLDVTPEETKARQLREAVNAAKQGIAPKGIAKGAAGRFVAADGGAELLSGNQVPGAATPESGLVEAGEKAFRKCKACHEVGEGAKNRSGPHLNGVAGRAAAGVNGFKYSKAMNAAAKDGLIWNDEELAGFLAKPRAYMKGTKMSFAGLKTEDEIAATIAFLKTFSPSPADAVDGGASEFAAEVTLDPSVLAMKGDPEYGEYLSSECTTCHQADGDDDGIPSIVLWPEERFVTVMHAYKLGAREHSVMNMIAGRLGNEEIAALAAYFATLEN